MPPLQNTTWCSSQLVAVAVGSEIFVLDRNTSDCFHVFEVDTETWGTVDIPSEVPIPNASNYTNGVVPWPNLCVDGTRIRVLIHSNNRHCVFDTVNASWSIVQSYDTATHMACNESNRIYSVVTRDGWKWLNVYQKVFYTHESWNLSPNAGPRVPVRALRPLQPIFYLDMA